MTADSRPTVLFLHPSDELYGADRSLLRMVRATRDMCRPIVLLPNDLPYSGALSRALRTEGVDVRIGPLPVVRRRYLRPTALMKWATAAWRGVAWIAQTARKENAVGIVTNTTGVVFGPFVCGTLRLRHVWYIREIIEQPQWFRAFVRLNARLSGGVIVAVSGAVASWVGRVSGHGPRILRNAVDIPGAPSELGAVPLAVFVGRLNAWKGHRAFVQMACAVHGRVPSSRFAMIGGAVPGEEEAARETEALVAAADPTGEWLAWRGEVPNTRSTIRDAWVVVVPSLRPDPLPNVVLEAMAEGRAVIGSHMGGIPEMVEDGRTGLLVDPLDETAFADAVASLLSDRQRSADLGHAGYARASEAFSDSAFRRAWRGLLGEQLLGHRTDPSSEIS